MPIISQLEILKKNFSYIFDLNNKSGRPRINLIEVVRQFTDQGIKVIPLKSNTVIGIYLDIGLIILLILQIVV